MGLTKREGTALLLPSDTGNAREWKSMGPISPIHFPITNLTFFPASVPSIAFKLDVSLSKCARIDSNFVFPSFEEKKLTIYNNQY